MSRATLAISFILLVSLAACADFGFGQRDAGQTTTISPTASPTIPSQEGGDGAATPAATRPVTTTTPTIQTIRIWVPPDVAARTENGQTTLQTQLRSIAAGYDNLEIIMEQKAVSGLGGILSYLRSGRNVAPSILPDLIALPTEQLTTAGADGLIYPLDDLLDPAALEDLYPAGQALAQPDEEILGYPFALTALPHLAYNTQIVSGTLPLTWNGLITDTNHSLVLPASGRGGATLGLQLYLAAGGALANEAGQPALQVEPLTAALQQLNQAVAEGIILPQSSTLTTPEETWQSFQNGNSAIVQTTADQFLLRQDRETPLQVAPMPGIEDRLTPLVNGWAWAISTPDPTQQALALDFILALVEGEKLGEWSHRSRILPARRSALATWPADEPFLPFAQRELEIATPYPISTDGIVAQALSNAVFDVVSQTKSPQEAADEAVSELQP